MYKNQSCMDHRKALAAYPIGLGHSCLKIYFMDIARKFSPIFFSPIKEISKWTV